MVLPPAYGGGDTVTINNPVGTLYLKGNESTDGSIRLVPDATAEKNVEMQHRIDGVWNETGVQLNQASIAMGRELIIAAAGANIQTEALNEGKTFLAPKIEFSDEGATFPVAASTSPKFVKFVATADDSSELVGTLIPTIGSTPVPTLTSQLYLQAGSVAATKPVTVTFFRGSLNTDPILWQQEFPASVFGPANTEIVIPFNGLLDAAVDVPLLTEYTSAADFSLKTNAAQTAVTLSADFFLLGEHQVLTDNLILGNDLEIAFANSLDLVVPNLVFPTVP